MSVGEDPVELFSNAVPAARSRTRGFSLRPWSRAGFVERWTGDDGRARLTQGEVLALVPQRLLRLSWADDDWKATTTVEFGIEVFDSDRTEVRVTHIGWEQFGDRASQMWMAHEAGWRVSP